MRFSLALLFSFTPAIALAQSDAGTSTVADAGPPDAGGCGPITLAGECRDNIVVFCDELEDELILIDCEAEYGPTAICQEIEAEYGVDCALAAGEQCLYDDGGDFFTDFCQGTGAGCVETPEDATCEEDLGTCTSADVRTCRGQRLIYECNVNQPWVVDCEAFLGSCEQDHCLVPSGILCDEDVLLCQPGSICSLDGFCETVPVDAGAPDSGSAAPDAGTSMDDDDDGCTCATSQNDRRIPYLPLLVAAWFIVRRRGR